MILFLYILFALSFITNSLNISLIESWRDRVFACLIPSFICLSFYSFSLSQNNQFIEWVTGQPNLISGIALIQTFEALIFIFITMVQIQSYYGSYFPNLWKWFSFLPSLQLVLGLIFLQTYTFIKIDGLNFFYVALGFLLSSFTSIFFTSSVLKRLFKRWGFRAELKSLLLTFQILLAMFFPLVVKGLNVTYTQITFDTTSISLTFATLISFGGYGFYKYKTNNGTL